MAPNAAKLQVVGGGKDVGDEELRLWLEAYIAEHPHLNTAILARRDHIGYQRTALDAYLKGTYFLAKESGGMGVNPAASGVEKKIRAYRMKVDGTVRHGYSNSFLKTTSWSQFQHACQTAIDENVIVVVYARPGVGKSRCMREFAKEKMTTMPISILCSANITTRYFVQKIARDLGLSDVPPTAKLEDNVIERLRRNPRPLFVDQANYLNEKALGSICYIWEVAQIPIVLVGTKDLYDLFNTSRLTQDVRVQLSSRVAMHYPLKELSKEEVNTIVERILGGRATPDIKSRIFNATSGNHRHLDMIMPRLAHLIERNVEALDDPNDPDVTMEALVDTATSRLMVG